MYPRIEGYDPPEKISGLKDRVWNLVVIPSRNAAATIPYVIYNAAEGLEKLGKPWAIIVIDGLSTDQTLPIVNVVKRDIGEDKLFIAPNTVSPGKGGAMKLAAEIADKLGIQNLVFLDSDLRSITPEWPIQLVMAAERCGYGTPNYIRDRFDATITNFVARPLTVMAYLVNIKQPIGGEFGLGRRLIEHLSRRAPWNSAYWNLLFGTDIFITHTALSMGITPCEASLGSKIHEAKDPGKRLKGMFIEVAGSLYNALLEYGDKWMNNNGEVIEPKQITKPAPVFIPPPRVSIDPSKAYGFYAEASKEPLSSIIEKLLKPSDEVLSKIREAGELSSSDWAKILYSGFRAYVSTPIHKYRELILEALFHLWQGRLYTYYEQVGDAPIELVNEVVWGQVEDVLAIRDRFVEELRKYVVY